MKIEQEMCLRSLTKQLDLNTMCSKFKVSSDFYTDISIRRNYQGVSGAVTVTEGRKERERLL